MTARSLQITLLAGLTPISATPAYFNQMIVQNNATHSCTFGDSTISATKGIVLAASASSNIGSVTVGQGDASQFYLYGTAGDKIDILLV